MSSEEAAPSRPRSRSTGVFIGFTVVTLASLLGLGYVGVGATNRLTGGSALETITDPTKPGYVEAVAPSPVFELLLTDANEQLSAVLAIVPEQGEGPASIVWAMGELLVGAGADSTIDENSEVRPLREVYAKDGKEAAGLEFEKALGFGVTERLVMNPDDLEALAKPIGKITVTNPDAILEGTKERSVRYPAGDVELEPDELGEFLTFVGVGEAPADRAIRTRTVLAELVKAGGFGSSVATDHGTDAQVVFETFGSRPPRFDALPVISQEFQGSFLYRPDIEESATQFATLVQSPVSAFPGQRPRVRILSGIGQIEDARTFVSEVSAVGGEVLSLGNTDPLGIELTSVEFINPRYETIANAIADKLGVSAIRVDGDDSASDISVIIGKKTTS
ncbi:MAG TPA: hypothetical protein DEG43_13835 [Acidimicrobiaceae bacterium]|nr:hypothetical protein [Acidimicrobiaceae bacterium]